MEALELERQIQEQFSWYTPPGGVPVQLSFTTELRYDAEAWLKSECVHEFKDFRRRIARNGTTQIFEFCLFCGQNFGHAISHKKFPNIKEIPVIEVDFDVYFDERLKVKHQIKHRHFLRQNASKSLWCQNYLLSEKWKIISAKVMRRANGVCEGCLEARASQVHHLSYYNIGDEFIFELVAVCRECHQRYHENERC